MEAEIVLRRYGASEAFIWLINDAIRNDPIGQQFRFSAWHFGLLSAAPQHRVVQVGIQNSDLQMLVKCWILSEWIAKKKPAIRYYAGLSEVGRRFNAVAGDLAAKKLSRDHVVSTVESGRNDREKYVLAKALTKFSRWLDRELNFKVGYETNLRHTYGNIERDIDTTYLAALRLLGCNVGPDICEKDKFYLALTMVLACTGLRANELMTLSADCLLKIDGQVAIRFGESKGSKPLVRHVAPVLQDDLVDAITYLQQVTEPGRVIARRTARPTRERWVDVAKSDEATTYFLARLAHVLSSEQEPLNALRSAIKAEDLGYAAHAYDQMGVNFETAAEYMNMTPDELSHAMCKEINQTLNRLPSYDEINIARLVHTLKNSATWNTENERLGAKRRK